MTMNGGHMPTRSLAIRSSEYALPEPGEWCPPTTIIDLSSDGPPGLIAELVDAFHDDGVVRLVELNNALEHSELDRIKRAAHSIRGAARQMGAEGVSAISESIEQQAAAGNCEDLIDLACRLRWVFLRECESMRDYLQRQGCVLSAAKIRPCR